MSNAFIRSFRSEWLKKKRTASAWLVLIGGFLVPLIILIARFVNADTLYDETVSPHLWEIIFRRCWQFMAIFLLPLGVILATSLITQIEFRNNTWKQIHTSPQSFTTIFFAKLSVILVMVIQFFILFNIGMYLAGILPSLLKPSLPFPAAPFPFLPLLKANGLFFIDCLPIVALQYIISLQFRNFLVPLGAGLGLFIASMIAVNWKYGFIIPYTSCILQFLGKQLSSQHEHIPQIAAMYFLLFITTGYFLYLRKKAKG